MMIGGMIPNRDALLNIGTRSRSLVFVIVPLLSTLATILMLDEASPQSSDRLIEA
jgi:hypothetical protein